MDKNRLNEEDNIFLDPSSGELTFGKIFKVLKYSLLRMVVYLLIAAVIAGSVCLVLSATSTTTKNVSTVIEYNYDGINSGLDPNGDKFNKERIKNTNVLKRAILSANLKEDEKLNLSTLASSIIVKDVIPAKDLAILQSLKEQANKDPNINAQIIDKVFYPTRFIVYINDYDKLGLSEKSATTLLEEIVKAHQEDWKKSYISNPVLSSDLFESLANGEIKYEFMHYQTLLNFEIAKLKNFLKAYENVNYKSSDGVTFTDLLSEVNVFERTEYNTCTAFISDNKIVNDPKILMSSLKQEEENLTNERDRLTALIDNLESQLAQIKQTQVIIPGSDTNDNKGGLIEVGYPKEYWSIHKVLIQYNSDRALVNSNLAITQKTIEKLGSPTESDTDLMQKATDRLISVAKTFLSIANRAQKLTDEYKSNVSLSTSVYKTMPVTSANDSSLSNKLVLATFLVAIVVALVAAIVVTVKSQKKFAFKRMNSNNNSNETKVVEDKQETESHEENND